MTAVESVNIDTNILVNYVYSSISEDIEKDVGSQAIIDSESFHIVIGGKTEDEFQAICERRYTLYEDVVSYLLEGDNSIFEYEPRNRSVQVSSNDRGHFRNSSW